jgi:hypothetical protein
MLQYVKAWKPSQVAVSPTVEDDRYWLDEDFTDEREQGPLDSYIV